MKQFIFFIFFIVIFSLLQCGGSKLEEGDLQYSQGKYTPALNNYMSYKKDNPQDKSVNPKIALSFMNRGKELYAKTRNIETFSGNFKKADQFLEEGFTLPEHKNQYSELLYELALAFKKAKPQNEVQKEQYFNNTLANLNLAMEINENNQKADSLIAMIYQENFKKMYDKGLKFYNRAKKERNNADLYLSAESYFVKAAKFNSSNEDAEKYLSNTREQTIKILQSNYPFSFCVPNYQQKKNIVFIDFSVQNFSTETIVFDLDKLELTSDNGEVFKVDLKKTAELENAFIDQTKLEPRKRVDGQIVFALAPNTVIQSLDYNYNEETVINKYFP
jgi:tetratricopeptide (TPR) repeat protein